jgi:signal transduction histidine kinase
MNTHFKIYKLSLKISVVVLILFILFPQKTFSQDKVKSIVIFFSNSASLPAFQNILDGFKSSVSQSNELPVNLVVEYLDVGRLENEEHARYVINLYNKKFNEIKIDLFITVGPGINTLLLKYGEDVLKTVPIINIDLDLPGRIPLHDLNVKNGMEIVLKYKMNNTLKAAFGLFPQYKNVFVISGKSATDLYYMSLVEKAKTEFGRAYNFKFISDLSIDSTIRFVRKIPHNSIVIVPAFLRDAKNIPFSTAEALSLISINSVAPVFPISDAVGKKDGGIGGCVFSYINLGRELGRISRTVLNGVQFRDITVNETSFYQNIYDWQELKRWHLINSDAIPGESIFYNKDTSFLVMYKWYILGLFMFLVSQTLFIIYLVTLNKRQKLITGRMLETERMYRELIRTDRLSKMSSLTASLSHELNQPLSAIRFTAQAGKRFIQSGKLDMVRASSLFENILEDNIRATAIINSVKNLMKPGMPDKKNVNLNALIDETVDIVRTDAIKQRIKIHIKFDTESVFVLGDKIQLQQVLMNFIRNATSAMENIDPDGRILEILLKADMKSVIVSVCDSGPGIDTSIQEKLFSPFVTTKKDGFGIGLTLCKSIIEKHNGKIWAEKSPEGGAIFSFNLQVVKNINDE